MRFQANGVYDLLENYLGVRWLWPGKLGEVIPSRKNLTLPALNGSIKPLLWFKEWRGGLSRPDWDRSDFHGLFRPICKVLEGRVRTGPLASAGRESRLLRL
jgi:hypothetical protein